MCRPKTNTIFMSVSAAAKTPDTYSVRTSACRKWNDVGSRCVAPCDASSCAAGCDMLQGRLLTEIVDGEQHCRGVLTSFPLRK